MAVIKTHFTVYSTLPLLRRVAYCSEFHVAGRSTIVFLLLLNFT